MNARTPVQSLHPWPALRMLITGSAVKQRGRLSQALETLRFPVVAEWANDAQHALDILEDAPRFDIVFCDVSSEIDGAEFLYHAAAHKPSAFVLLSAGGPDRVQSASILVQRHGARLLGVLELPLRAEQLQALLKRYRESSAPREDSFSAPRSRDWTTQQLLRGLERSEFIPYFQPKVDLQSGRRNCVEILARWRHPEFGILQPDEFIGPMEREGLIDRLTASLLVQSLDLAGTYERRGWQFGMAINVSPLTLEDSGVPRRMYSMVKQHGIPTERITIEVTETATANDMSTVMESLARMRMLGFEISVDDFGTGYSSLEMLNQVPFTELKIDRSFVAGLTAGDDKAGAIVTTIMQLAKRLGLRTVAEGIETRSQLAVIRRLGCTTGQGYLLGKPMPPAGFVADCLQEQAFAA